MCVHSGCHSRWRDVSFLLSGQSQEARCWKPGSHSEGGLFLGQDHLELSLGLMLKPDSISVTRRLRLRWALMPCV